MMTRARIFSLTGLAILGFLLGLAVASVSASPPTDDPPPTGPEVMGIRVPPADGTPAISENAARLAASKLHPELETRASSTSAAYVLFSYDSFFTDLPDGTRQYKFQNVPAWLFTFTGLDLPSHSGYPVVNHEYNVVIDARTGEGLWEFSYR